MRKKLVIVAITILQVIVVSLMAKAQESKSSLLWKISGNGLSNTSYIFGTIHMIPKSDYFFYESWENCFDSCKALALEIDLNISKSEQISLAKSKMMLPDGKSLKDFMSESEYLSFKGYMLDSLKIKPFMFQMYDKIKPFYTYSLLLTEIMGKDIEMYEMRLNKMAQKRKMTTSGLETLEFQMSLVDSISIADQITMFLQWDGSVESKLITEFNDLLEVYKKEDIEQIYLKTVTESDAAAIEEDFLNKRNINWIPEIEKLITQQATFIAVGAAHLGGDKGVIALLKKQGYQLTPVE